MPSRSLRSFGMRARLKRFRGMTLEQQAQRATLLGDALDALPANLLSGSDAFGSYDSTLTSALTTALTGRGSNKRSSVGKGGRGALGADPPGHLHLNYKAFICDIQDPNTEATFFLYRHNDQRIISEPFSVALQVDWSPSPLPPFAVLRGCWCWLPRAFSICWRGCLCFTTPSFLSCSHLCSRNPAGWPSADRPSWGHPNVVLQHFGRRSHLAGSLPRLPHLPSRCGNSLFFFDFFFFSLLK